MLGVELYRLQRILYLKGKDDCFKKTVATAVADDDFLEMHCLSQGGMSPPLPLAVIFCFSFLLSLLALS